MKNNKEIIRKLKEEIVAMAVTVKKAIASDLYLETDRAFIKILEDILGTIDNINLEAYNMALSFRDEKLNRPKKSEEEFDKYFAYLMDTDNAEDYAKLKKDKKDQISKTTSQVIDELKALSFTEILSRMVQEHEYKNLNKDYEFNSEIRKRYNKGVQLLMTAINTHLYRVTDRQFYNILKDILKGRSKATEVVYKLALYNRDAELNRPYKSEKEYEAYISYLESTIEDEDFKVKV